jgi:hypothetical protein
VLAALAAAHGRDIVHRDIKPGNIFLVRRQLDDIRILDFGIARRRLDIKRFTRDGATVGTPLYTSPEQARGRGDVDGRADIFSLGCVLFEALAGEPPFGGESPLEVMTRVCAGRCSDLDLKRPGLPVGLSALVRAMLAPDPAERPQSAAALAEEFAKQTTIKATPEPASPSRARPTGSSPAEERPMSAMLVSRGKPGRTDANAFAAGMRRLAERHGCLMDRLIDRNFLLTATCASLEEQAVCLASLALAVRGFDPDVRIAIATGRTAVIGHLPVGALMERLPLMLRAPEPGAIRLDSTTRQCLPSVFQVAPVHSGFLLLSTGEGPGALAAEEVSDDGSDPGTPSPLPRRGHHSVTDG